MQTTENDLWACFKDQKTTKSAFMCVFLKYVLFFHFPNDFALFQPFLPAFWQKSGKNCGKEAMQTEKPSLGMFQ